MVNKDQLEQTSEGKQVLALMAEHFTEEQFQPALTLIEQRYTEDLTVWDNELNRDSKWPFSRTTSAQRLLIFFTGRDLLTGIKAELARREAEHARQVTQAPAKKVPTSAKPRAKVKTKAKVSGPAQKVRGRKTGAVKVVKKKPATRQKNKPSAKGRKQKSRPSKAKKSPAKKKQKVSKKKRS